MFTAYALVLFAAVASLITTMVMAGVAVLPTPLVFLEHLAMSLAFRAAYKGIGGFSWGEWTLTSGGIAEVIPVTEPTTEPSITRKAA
jgi:hypothetical protein